MMEDDPSGTGPSSSPQSETQQEFASMTSSQGFPLFRTSSSSFEQPPTCDPQDTFATQPDLDPTTSSTDATQARQGSSFVDLTESSPPLPRPTVIANSNTSSRSSSRNSSSTSRRSASPPHLQTDSRSRTRSRALTRQASTSSSGAPRSHPGIPTHLRTSTWSPSPPALLTQRSSTERDFERRSIQERASARPFTPQADILEISSDSSEDEIIDVTPADAAISRPNDTSTDFFEVSEVRRAPSIRPTGPEDILSPPPVPGRPAEPIRFRYRANGSGAVGTDGRLVGISVDPSTGDFLTRPMPIVVPAARQPHHGGDGSSPAESSGADTDVELIADESSSIVPLQAEAARPQRSAHPITDQRLKNTNLVMPTASPPRSRPPPIERPLLSKFTCPICFEAPSNPCVTPCGHLFCGECLFQALKTQAVQRGLLQEDHVLFGLEGRLFGNFAQPGSNDAYADVGGGPAQQSEGGPASGTRSSGYASRNARGGSRNAGASRSRKPDPLAGQCPVCRAKIKGGFNGKIPTGILGMRIMIGKPVDDPREESGKLKTDTIPSKPSPQLAPTSASTNADEASTNAEDDDDEACLPTTSSTANPSSSKESTNPTEANGNASMATTSGSPQSLRKRRKASEDLPNGDMSPTSPTTPRKRPRQSVEQT